MHSQRGPCSERKCETTMAACLCLLSAHSQAHLLVIFLKGYHTTIFTIHNYSLIQLPVFSHYYKKKNSYKNRARGNRKTPKRPKMMSKINFRTLKLKSHEEYLICRTYFVLVKDLIFKLNRKVERGERNDKMACKSKFKAFLSI